MPDPFEALRAPVTRVDPDPEFAARLRARVERALTLPKGVIVSDVTITAEPAATTVAGTVVPYLIVNDGRAALDWYVEALGARRRGEALTMPDGRVGHAEFELSGSVLYLADESPESHVAAPRPGADATVSLDVQVGDVDAAVDRALGRGATLERPAADHPYGRNAVIRDPYGHRWILSALPAPTVARPAHVEPIRHGDVGYVSLWVPDVERAAIFFSSVLGWTYGPGSDQQNRMVESATLNHGLSGGHDHSTLFLCFAVDDVESALERVRGAGGQAEEPTDEPYGRIAMCVDSEGANFAVYQPPAGQREQRPALNGSVPGDLSYITMEVANSAEARAFYGSVLGWHFVPGRVDDGWAPVDVAPMTGMHGGHQIPTVVPMYRVNDIHEAVGRVRAGGGTATDPELQPYGLSSECVDDQGTHFYLGDL